MAERPVYLVICVVLLYGSSIHGEMFTAMSDMEHLIYLESEMVDALKEYLRAEQARLDELTKFADDFEALSKKATQDAEEYLHHPVNAFLTVKRFMVDWNNVNQLVKEDMASQYMNNISQHEAYFPTPEDLKGAGKALFRLQDTYQLECADIADGNINDLENCPKLTAEDCFQLGRVAYEEADNYYSEMWMREALRHLESENPPTMRKSAVLDYLSYSTYMNGDPMEALRLTDELLEIDPLHERALGNKAYFENELGVNVKQRGDVGEVQDGETERVKPKRSSGDHYGGFLPEREKYEALCRGEMVNMSPERQRKLKCRYRHYNRPYLYLQPAKEEVVFDKPKLTLYRDSLSDEEIRRVKELAAPRLRRATIQNSVTGNLEYAEYRISKSAWLRETDDDVIARINRRIEYYTGLTMDTAEELQVANYGIGGHYEPHFDFTKLRKEELNAFKELNSGNRIATMLFYMSDVAAGGATVFPRIGARLLPEKGTGAFWYNLLQSGEGDYTTRHAACPVLVGSKWVSNKWIHEYGQEFRRQCYRPEEQAEN
ncbi:prolyl 4-hydroxylase subunit alpha-1-like isoform X2 [Glandiceps talaboti]